MHKVRRAVVQRLNKQINIQTSFLQYSIRLKLQVVIYMYSYNLQGGSHPSDKNVFHETVMVSFFCCCQDFLNFNNSSVIA